MNYRPAPDLLNDRIILVTGAGAGIGRCAAISYAALGATVILLGRTEEKLNRVYDDIVAAGNPEPVIVPMDLQGAEEEAFFDLAAQIREHFGRLDGLLHNASILGQRTPISEYNPATWQAVMQVNVNAPFLLTQALLPLLEAGNHASVIFTSSGVGRKGRAFWGAYAVSKFATEGLMQTLADEYEGLGSIRVNAINPGGTRSKMRSQAFPAEDPSTLPEPQQIMPLYLYLMGPDSQDIHGQSIDAREFCPITTASP